MLHWGNVPELEKMLTICIALGCSNQKDKAKGILPHQMPFLNDEHPEKKRCRKKWVDSLKWEPSKYSVKCSVHFNQWTDFT